MFTQQCMHYGEGSIQTIDPQTNKAVRTPAKWSRPQCAMLLYKNLANLEADVNAYLANTSTHVVSVSDYGCVGPAPTRYTYTCTLVYQDRLEEQS